MHTVLVHTLHLLGTSSSLLNMPKGKGQSSIRIDDNFPVPGFKPGHCDRFPSLWMNIYLSEHQKATEGKLKVSYIYLEGNPRWHFSSPLRLVWPWSKGFSQWLDLVCKFCHPSKEQKMNSMQKMGFQSDEHLQLLLNNRCHPHPIVHLHFNLAWSACSPKIPVTGSFWYLDLREEAHRW